MSKNVRLSSPWVTFYHEIEALFADDPDVIVNLLDDNNDCVIQLFVDGQTKADAITELLPTEKVFAGVTVYINVIPSNKPATKIDLFRQAFDGNPALSYTATIEEVFTNPISYVVFRNKVVQFFNDDLGDVNGNKSTLYQEIAKDVFDEHEGICFCTDVEKNIGKPLDK